MTHATNYDGYRSEKFFEDMLISNQIPYSNIPFRTNNPLEKFSLDEILYIALYIASNGKCNLPPEFTGGSSHKTLQKLGPLEPKLVDIMNSKLHGFLVSLKKKSAKDIWLDENTTLAFEQSIDMGLFEYTDVEETFDSLFGTDLIMGLYTTPPQKVKLIWVAVDITHQSGREVERKNEYMKLLFPVLSSIFGIQKTAVIHFDIKKGVNLPKIIRSITQYENQKYFTL